MCAVSQQTMCVLSMLFLLNVRTGFGLRVQFAVCFMCTSMYRALLIDQKDPSIMDKSKFSTTLFDFCDAFAPPSSPASAPSVLARVKSLVLAIFAPGLAIRKVADNIYNDSYTSVVHAVGSSVIFYSWFILMCMDAPGNTKNVGYYYALGWSLFMIFVCWVTFLRSQIRGKYNIYGSEVEDLFCALVAYPMTLSQLELQTEVTEDMVKATEVYSS